MNEINKNSKKVKRGILIIIGSIGFLVPLISGFFGAYLAWTDWQLREDLRKGGIQTKAAMRGCTGRRLCRATYEFPVTVDGNLKRYQGEDRIRCYECPLNAVAEIRYMPQDPTRSGLEGRSLVSFWVKISLAMLLMYPSWWIMDNSDVIKAKGKRWLNLSNPNKKE